MAWASVGGSCEEPGDACSSGWIKRCEKGRAQIFLLLSLPLCFRADSIFQTSLHLVPPQCGWEFSGEVFQEAEWTPPSQGLGCWPVQPDLPISSPAESWWEIGNKMPKSRSYSKQSLCMIILCLTAPGGCLEDVNDLSFTRRDPRANCTLHTVW